MNIVEELRSLDINEPGRWPLPFRMAAIALVFVAIAAAGVYYFVVRTEFPLLEQAQNDELALKETFETKQRRAANFDAYRIQLAEIERSFGTMLRQLPGKTEIPSLLVDISQTALGAGLDENLFQRGVEVQKDFYAEQPIKIRYTGSYHELGNFVSGVAGLPRIVTLHDINIKPASNDEIDVLTLDATAKTYRYLDEDSTEGG
ncbi:MAG TPA: type 4a pilus biogenesis protein PilO [Gammaproteobacteria bacterium]|jgi:type IV pilus assembly protein PilO